MIEPNRILQEIKQLKKERDKLIPIDSFVDIWKYIKLDSKYWWKKRKFLKMGRKYSW